MTASGSPELPCDEPSCLQERGHRGHCNHAAPMSAGEMHWRMRATDLERELSACEQKLAAARHELALTKTNAGV
jgi:hypothetical protein